MGGSAYTPTDPIENVQHIDILLTVVILLHEKPACVNNILTRLFTGLSKKSTIDAVIGL